MKLSNTHPKIEAVVAEIISDQALSHYDYFGHFGLYLNYKEANDLVPTCGVTCQRGQLIFLYNTDFIEKLSHKQMMFVYMHEIMHLVSDHLGRAKRNNFDGKLSNIAADMIINDTLLTGDYLPVDRLDMPKVGIRMHEEYKGHWIMEDLYEWLQDDPDKADEAMNEAKANGGESEGPDGDNGETLDVHLDSDEMKTQTALVKDIMEGLKARGIGSSELHSKLDKLRATKINYLKTVKKIASRMKGLAQKEKTMKRPNRKGIYGLKGRRKLSQEIVCLLDTSGSMWGEFEKVLETINREGLVINLIYCDTEIKRVDKILDKKQLQNVDIAGGGGTELQPGIDYATKNFPQLPIVVLTDGYCDRLNFNKSKIPGLIISTGIEVQIDGGKATNILLERK